MGVDRREAILARLLDVATAIDGVASAARNKLFTQDTDLPAITVMDADEEAFDADPQQQRPGNAPRRVAMKPEILIQAGVGTADIGTTVNAIRAALIKAISSDATLTGLMLDRNGIHYLGCGTAFALGRDALVTMALNFQFSYALRPDEL